MDLDTPFGSFDTTSLVIVVLIIRILSAEDIRRSSIIGWHIRCSVKIWYNTFKIFPCQPPAVSLKCLKFHSGQLS